MILPQTTLPSERKRLRRYFTAVDGESDLEPPSRKMYLVN